MFLRVPAATTAHNAYQEKRSLPEMGKTPVGNFRMESSCINKRQIFHPLDGKSSLHSRLPLDKIKHRMYFTDVGVLSKRRLLPHIAG